MRIGVIGCTHIPQAMPRLPEKIKSAFRGLDIILHVGDVTDIPTLKELENNFTITIAVSGEQDSAELKKYVEPKRVVEFANRRIGMIHGDQLLPAPTRGVVRRLQARFAKPAPVTDYYDLLLQQFDGVDAIIFGHTHRPYARVHQGVFLFNPGAASPMGERHASVGILEIEPRSISGRFVYV